MGKIKIKDCHGLLFRDVTIIRSKYCEIPIYHEICVPPEALERLAHEIGNGFVDWDMVEYMSLGGGITYSYLLDTGASRESWTDISENYRFKNLKETYSLKNLPESLRWQGGKRFIEKYRGYAIYLKDNEYIALPKPKLGSICGKTIEEVKECIDYIEQEKALKDWIKEK